MKEKKENLSLSIGKENYAVPHISKASVDGTAENMYNSIMEGATSAVLVAEFFKFSSEVEKKLKEMSDDRGNNSFTELVRNEIQSNSDDGVSVNSKFGTKLSLTEAGIKYDYSKSNDPVWNDLNAQIKLLEKKIKERETFLKSLSSPILISIPNEETGELLENIQIYPPAKSSTSTYKVELLKD